MSKLDELDLLRRITPLLPGNDSVIAGAGDDCAVLKWNDEYDLLVTVDQLIRGVHYTFSTSPAAAGAKLMKRNLSDIAAMGGEPLWAVVTLASGESAAGGLQEFMQGVCSEGAKYDTAVCGGDISSVKEDTFVATLTLAGRVPKGEAVMRSGAKPGDILYVTGVIGNSFASEHHLNFTPRLDLAAALRKEAHAMLDISDGFLLDAQRLAASSQVDIEIDMNAVPLRSGAALPGALSDGEDYELLFCGRPGLPWHAVGEVVPGEGKLRVPGFEENAYYGFQH